MQPSVESAFSFECHPSSPSHAVAVAAACLVFLSNVSIGLLVSEYVGKWFAEEEKKLAEVVYHLSGANPGQFFNYTFS